MGRRPTTIRSLEERFWSRVDKTGSCWLWVGARNPQGYGKVFIQGSQYMATHRAAWTLENGPIPKGLSVLHKCDTPSCVRPSHLFTGTQSDNMRDCRSKGRIRFPDNRGEKYGAAKLTDQQVGQIRALCKASILTHEQIAKRFNVSRTHVSAISRRAFWRHVP